MTNAGIEAAAQEAFSAITAVCITEDGNTTLADHVASKIRSLTRPSSSATVERREAVDDPLVDLVARFSEALLGKLKAARVKYGYDEGWRDGGWEADCQKHLITHLAKGDPRDVAAYCAFMWHHGWSTAAPESDAILPLPGSSRDEVLASVNAALFEPDESEAIDNLEGALTDIKRLSEAGKPTDAVCIRTLERIQSQLVNAHRALKSGGAK